MGTNFYLHRKPPCPTCKRPDGEGLHIGKSSAGWVFSLHVIPEEGINSLSDWVREWAQPGAWIVDEYGDEIDRDEMIVKIAGRMRTDGKPLARSASYGKHCIGNGPGTWDLIKGEFS